MNNPTEQTSSDSAREISPCGEFELVQISPTRSQWRRIATAETAGERHHRAMISMDTPKSGPNPTQGQAAPETAAALAQVTAQRDALLAACKALRRVFVPSRDMFVHAAQHNAFDDANDAIAQAESEAQ